MKMCFLQTWPCATQHESPRNATRQTREFGSPAPSQHALPSKTFWQAAHLEPFPTASLSFAFSLGQRDFAEWRCGCPLHTQKTLNPDSRCSRPVGVQDTRQEPCPSWQVTPATLGKCVQWPHNQMMGTLSENLQNWPKPERGFQNERNALFNGSWYQERGKQSAFAENSESMHFASSHHFVFSKMLAPDLKFHMPTFESAINGINFSESLQGMTYQIIWWLSSLVFSLLMYIYRMIYCK